MRTLDLRQQRVTVDELLRVARTESVLIVAEEGDEFILEVADAFEREVAELSQSEKFMAFLAERSKEPGVISLDDIERKLAQEE
jgi:predicted ATPase